MKVKLEFVRGIKFLVVNRFNDYTFLLWDMLIRTILSTDILLFVSRSASLQSIKKIELKSMMVREKYKKSNNIPISTNVLNCLSI